MMKKIKRIISIILLCGLASQFVVTQAQEDKTAMLDAIGILQGYSSADAKSTVTRGEFAKIILNLLYGEESFDEIELTNRFTDVPSNSPYATAVAVVDSRGFMHGSDDGKFYPEDKITCNQALKVIICILGYNYYAKTFGEYPGGYVTAASNLGLMDGVAYNGNENITLSQISQMIFNSLEIDLMEHTGFGENTKYEIIKDKTLLSENLKMFKGNGQVTGTVDTSLYGENNVKYDEVEIDYVKYKIGLTNSKSLLGQRVKFYYKQGKDSDTKTLYYIEPNLKTGETIVLKSEDIDRYEDNTYTYHTNDNTNIKEAKLLNGADIIWNGKALKVPYEMSMLLPQNGNVVLTDTDNDGLFDFVNITSYTVCVVQSTNSEDGIIYDRYSSANNVNLNFSSSDLQYTISDKDGYLLEFSDLKQWDVLTVAASQDNKLIHIIVSREIREGAITQYESDETESFIYIDDEKLNISHQLFENLSLSIGDKGTFYIDHNNTVYACNMEGMSSETYGYVINVAKKRGLSDEVEFKILTQSSRVMQYKAAKNVFINQTKIPAGNTAYDYFVRDGAVEPQVILYQLNDNGEISKIRKPGSFSIDANCLNLSTDGTFQYKTSAKSFAGKAMLGDKTVVFIVRAAQAGETDFDVYDEDNYAVKSSGYLVNDATYTIKTYQSQKNHLLADAVVVANTTTGSAIDRYTNITLIDKVTKVLNDKGEEVQKIQGINNGATVTYYTDTKISAMLKQGDAARFGTNSQGTINKVDLVFDADLGLQTNNPSDSFFALHRVMYAYVYEKNENTITVTMNPIINGKVPTDLELIAADKFKIYQYNSAEDRKKVGIATVNDIIDYKHSQTGCSRVLIHTSAGDPKSIIIYK